MVVVLASNRAFLVCSLLSGLLVVFRSVRVGRICSWLLDLFGVAIYQICSRFPGMLVIIGYIGVWRFSGLFAIVRFVRRSQVCWRFLGLLVVVRSCW